MATPNNDMYSAPSGATITAGRVAWPAWRLAMTPNTWATIGTTLASIDPKNSVVHNADYPALATWTKRSSGAGTNQTSNVGVILPWCGATYDFQNDVIWLPLGGGHGDYGGNEPYKFDMSLDTPAWTMVRPPSGAKSLIDVEGIPGGATAFGNSYLLDDGQETTGVYADGRPRSIHSYRKHVWTPAGLVMVRQGGTFTSVGDSSKWTWTLNETTGEWTYRTTPTGSYLGSSRGSSMYDATNNRVLWIGEALSGLWQIDLTTFAWTRIGTASKNAGVIDGWVIAKDNKCFGVSDAFGSGYAVWDHQTGVLTAITTQGTPPSFAISPEGAFAWVDSLNAVVFFSDLSGSLGQIWLLTPGTNLATDPWTWSQMSVSGTVPARTASGGVYGRFGYSPNLNGFYYINSAGNPVYFLPVS